MSDTNTAMPTFKLGLSMAGAVSAGAYTAGALDFLLQALDEWTAAKARGDKVPQHHVSLEAASGASAGAMCAALLAIALPYRFPHVRIDTAGNASTDDGASPACNPLYKAWVTAIDIHPLLDTGDLDQGRLDALLNCQVIDDIVNASLSYSAPLQPRPFIAQPLVTRFSLGNLRGVPYRIDFRGGRKVNDEAMREQADYQGFLIGDAAAQPDPVPLYLCGHAALAAQSITDRPHWNALGDAAVASGAFPLFLKPRLISRSPADYEARHFVESSLDGVALQAIPPAWEDPANPPTQYSFACVDGGVFNNEPFELAREVLAGGPGKRNPRAADAADAAVLMVAPFMSVPYDGDAPNVVIDPLSQRPRLLLSPLAQIMPLINAWIMQSRFRPDDLALAYDESVYSRFVLAPSGSNAPDAAAYWIASGGLDGFLGFFHEDFRKHDYQLGRRNCQRLLAEHFTLPADNAIVAAGYANLLGDEAALSQYRSGDGQLPIIPLVGAARAEEPLMHWPAGVFSTASLMPDIERRVDAVFRFYSQRLAASIVRNKLLQKLIGLVAGGAWRLFGRAQILQAIRSKLDAARVAQAL